MMMTQPTASTKTTSHSSPDAAACIAFDALKEYASGWSDEAQSEHIESHLAMCSSCQQTLRELELKPDTLLQSLQRTAVEASRSAEDHLPDPLAEPVIDAALSRARQLNKQVAIKLLPVMSAEDSDVRARFQREIRVVGRLNHPSIVAATDAGEIDGTQFLVMEYVPGLDLSRLARLLGKGTRSSTANYRSGRCESSSYRSLCHTSNDDGDDHY